MVKLTKQNPEAIREAIRQHQEAIRRLRIVLKYSEPPAARRAHSVDSQREKRNE